LWSVSSVRVAPPGTNNRWHLRPRNLHSGGVHHAETNEVAVSK